MTDREIQDTAVDREAVRMIATVLGRLPSRPAGVFDLDAVEGPYDTAPIQQVDAAWRELAGQLGRVGIETLNAVQVDLERMASEGGNLSAEAGARALDLYAAVVDSRFDPAITGNQEIYAPDAG